MEEYQISKVPVNELNKWCGISYLDAQYKENVRLAFIFNDVTALVTTDDQVYLVGRNSHGSLATGSDAHYVTKVPIRVDALCHKRIVSFAFGAQKKITTPNHKSFRLSLFAVCQDGTVFGWGNCEHGNLGLRRNSTEPVSPTRIVFSTREYVSIAQLACGAGHSLALDRDGRVWGWGRNFFGQVGHGNRQDHTFPVPIRVGDEGTRAISVACGRTHSVALLADGKVFTWGQNSTAQLGQQTEEDFSLIPTQVCFPEDVPICKITCGKHHTLALTRDGTIFAWGRNDHGQLGQDNTNLELSFTPLVVNVPGVTDIAAVPHLSVSVCKSTTQLFMWGKLPEPTGKSICDPWDTFMNSISDVFSSFVLPTATYRPISTQTTHDYAKNAKIQFPDLVKWSALKFIHPRFLEDLKVAFVCGIGFEQTAILVTNTHEVLFVGRNVNGSFGTGVSTEFETRLPIKNTILTGKNICSFSFGLDVIGGAMCLFALTESGQVWSWAYNEYGELGIGGKSEGHVAVIPTRVGGALKSVRVAKIVSGADHTFAISSEGVMYGWGYNYSGQVGVNHCEEVVSPVRVQFKGKETKVVSAAAGMVHSVAVTAEGHVYAWGSNKDGRNQLGCETRDDHSAVPVRVKFPLGVRIEKVCCGPDCTFAISSRGHLYFWGYCPFQENVAATPIRVCTDIQEQICDVGTAHWSSVNAFQTRTGRVYAWGRFRGQSAVVKKPVECFRASSISDVFAFFSNPPAMISPLVSQPVETENVLDNLLNSQY